jgi:hypothetical protein
MFIHQRWGRLVETLPALQQKPHRPEDILKVDTDEDGGDDAAHALRYLVATKGRALGGRASLKGMFQVVSRFICWSEKHFAPGLIAPEIKPTLKPVPQTRHEPT